MKLLSSTPRLNQLPKQRNTLISIFSSLPDFSRHVIWLQRNICMTMCRQCELKNITIKRTKWWKYFLCQISRCKRFVFPLYIYFFMSFMHYLKINKNSLSNLRISVKRQAGLHALKHLTGSPDVSWLIFSYCWATKEDLWNREWGSPAEWPQWWNSTQGLLWSLPAGWHLSSTIGCALPQAIPWGSQSEKALKSHHYCTCKEEKTGHQFSWWTHLKPDITASMSDCNYLMGEKWNLNI